jgi:hypothetical protein
MPPKCGFDPARYAAYCKFFVEKLMILRQLPRTKRRIVLLTLWYAHGTESAHIR